MNTTLVLEVEGGGENLNEPDLGVVHTTINRKLYILAILKCLNMVLFLQVHASQRSKKPTFTKRRGFSLCWPLLPV